jgi:transposase
MAFNADGPDGLIDGKAPGARPRLNADQRDVLKSLVEQEPTPAAHSVVRWRLCDLAQILSEDHDVSVLREDAEPGPAGRGLPEALRSPA